MSTRSRALAALGLALALIGAASSGMSTAAAADRAPAPTVNPVDSATVVSGGFISASGGEQLSITVNASDPFTVLLAHLYNTSTNADTPEKMPLPAAGAPAGTSTWTVPVTAGTAPGDLPLGTYSLAVDVTFQDGTQITGVPGETISFQATPAFTLKVSTVLSHDNQDPSVTGTVDVLAPGATTGSPYENLPVTLVASGQANVTLNTDAGGGFRFPLTSPQPGETFYVEVPQSSTVAAGQSKTMTLTARSDRVQMSASLSASTVTYGGTVSVRGGVSYAPGAGSFVPLPGQSVRIYDKAGSTTPVATAVTNAKGAFTATLPKVATSVHWVLLTSGPYLNAAASTLPMKVNLPTAVTGFTATLNQFWQVSFRGCLGLRARVPGNVPALAALTIQYSTRPNGPWHKLGAVAKQTSYACGNGGRTFSGTLPAQLNFAYYRAVYAGGTDQAGTGYLPSASGAMLAWKYEDRITSFAVSARTVSKGGKLTVSGRLQYFSSKWRNYAGQQVLVILRPQGSKNWYWIVIAKTNTAGQFSATFTDPASASWSAEFLGNSTHLATVAPTIYVRVQS